MDNSHGEVLSSTPGPADFGPDGRVDPGVLAERLLDVVAAATRRVRREMRRNSSSELTVAQFRALRYVERHPGTDLSRFADHLGISRSSASALVERLHRAGYVARTADPVERRRIRIELSPSGLLIVGEATRHTRMWLSSRLESFSAADRDRLDAALQLLSRIASDSGDDRREGS